jgi:hypothetical protein
MRPRLDEFTFSGITNKWENEILQPLMKKLYFISTKSQVIAKIIE